MVEIERKFLINRMPELLGLAPIHYERVFINDDPARQKRVQRKGDTYELEEKIKNSDGTYSKTEQKIAQNDFERLTQGMPKDRWILRDSYALPDNISLKIYGGRFRGLVRAEVEFENLDEAETFIAPDWFGKEITESPLGSDAKLIKLTHQQFKELIAESSSDNLH